MPAFRPTPLPLLLLTGLLLVGCAASSRSPGTAELGTVSSTQALQAVLARGEPGPIGFERVVAADWAVDRAGLLNLEHRRARAAGLEAGPEPIQIYFYALTHPRFGTFLVDTGVESGFVGGANPRLAFAVRQALDTDALAIRTTTRDWLRAHGGRLAGVLLTHAHLDHISGLPDVPMEVPAYLGPGELAARAALNVFSQGTIDRMLGAERPLLEWRFEPDPSGVFDGVIDVFGDGSLWAIHVPGHSPGSTAFVVRTPEGAKLLVGDASHTRFGWEEGVEPGTFSHDGPRSARSLAKLRAFAAEHPIEVHLGHQALAGARMAGLLSVP